MSVEANNTQVKETSWHPYVEYDAKAERDNHEYWRVICKVAAWATVFFTSALLIGATAYVSLYAPEYLPAILISLPMFLGLAYSCFEFFNQKVQSHAEAVKLNNRIVEKIDALPKEVEELRQVIEDLGIKTEDLDDDEILKVGPTVARAQDLIEQTNEKIKKVREELDKEKVTIPVGDEELVVNPKEKILFENCNVKDAKSKDTGILGALYKRKIDLLDQLENALLMRIQAAYCLYVIQNPYGNREPSTSFDKRGFGALLRMIAKFNDDRQWNVLVSTKETDYTLQEIEDMSTAEVAEALFELNATPKPESEETAV